MKGTTNKYKTFFVYVNYNVLINTDMLINYKIKQKVPHFKLFNLAFFSVHLIFYWTFIFTYTYIHYINIKYL